MLEMVAEFHTKADHLRSIEGSEWLNGALAGADVSVLSNILENLFSETPTEEASESEESPMKHTKGQPSNVSSGKKDPKEATHEGLGHP